MTYNAYFYGENKKLHQIEIDMNYYDSIEEAIAEIKGIYKEAERVLVSVNN